MFTFMNQLTSIKIPFFSSSFKKVNLSHSLLNNNNNVHSIEKKDFSLSKEIKDYIQQSNQEIMKKKYIKKFFAFENADSSYNSEFKLNDIDKNIIENVKKILSQNKKESSFLTPFYLYTFKMSTLWPILIWNNNNNKSINHLNKSEKENGNIKKIFSVFDYQSNYFYYSYLGLLTGVIIYYYQRHNF